MFEALIFDFDGVLVESADIKTEAFRQLFSGYGDKAEEIVKYHRLHMGISRVLKFRYFYEQVLGQELSHEQEKELSERFSHIVLESILKAPFVAGTIDFLEFNYQKTPLFIASGTPDEELRYIVSQRGMSRYFREIHGTPRTKAEIVRDILSRYGWRASKVVFVGDAESDLRAAEENGISFIARISPSSDERLSVHPVKINTLYELEEALRKVDVLQRSEGKGGCQERVDSQRIIH